VAYCAEPEETVRAIRDWGCQVIAGNCETQLAQGADDCGCGFEDGTVCDMLAKGWYPYASARISADSRSWMRTLPATLRLTVVGLSICVVHGGVDVINSYVFASEKQSIGEELARAGADVVIAGHAGIPFIQRIGEKIWFNPGAIGMPANDGTPDVWYGLVQAAGNGVRLSTHRLRYDHLAAAAAMRRRGYADAYARALVTGLWPSLDILPEAERRETGKRIRPRALVLISRHKIQSNTKLLA
jgi:predicted phosphodiesterase